MDVAAYLQRDKKLVECCEATLNLMDILRGRLSYKPVPYEPAQREEYLNKYKHLPGGTRVQGPWRSDGQRPPLNRAIWFPDENSPPKKKKKVQYLMKDSRWV